MPELSPSLSSVREDEALALSSVTEKFEEVVVAPKEGCLSGCEHEAGSEHGLSAMAGCPLPKKTKEKVWNVGL